MKELVSQLTVCILTYNHGKFIGEALDSVLEQTTNFEWDILIADDCSTDDTRAIIKEYALKHPDKVKLILQEKNVGMQVNFRMLFLRPQSKYIAFLDGDDKWVDKFRLQKQFDFLEEHDDYNMVYGKGSLMDEESNPILYRRRPDFKSGYIFEDVLTSKYLPPMAAAVMRNREIKNMYATGLEPGVDFYVITAICKSGKAAFLDEVFFCYRINPNSITSTQLPYIKNLFLTIMEIYRKEYPRLVTKGIENGKLLLLYHYAEKDPGLKNFFLLLGYFRFSSLYARQVIKCLVNALKITINKKGNLIPNKAV